MAVHQVYTVMNYIMYEENKKINMQFFVTVSRLFITDGMLRRGLYVNIYLIIVGYRSREGSVIGGRSVLIIDHSKNQIHGFTQRAARS